MATASDFAEAEHPPNNRQAVIKMDLEGKVRFKRKTYPLSDKMVAQRLEKDPRLLKHLIHGRWRNVVNIDEVWCFVSHVNGRRRTFL